MRYLLIVLLTAFALTSSAAPLKFGETAPDWQLQDQEGNTIDYHKDSEGKVSVVLFWATWCPYCATLMPHLEVVYRKYRNKGLKFYAISTFEDGKLDPVEFFDTKGYTYKLLLNGDAVADEWGVKGTPGLYVMDKDKKVIYKKPTGVSDILVKQNMDLKIKQAIAR